MGFPTFPSQYTENINTFRVGLFILQVVKAFSVNSKANLYKQEALTDHYWAEKGTNEDKSGQI